MDMVRVKALMGFTEVTPEGMKVFNIGDEGELPIARAEDRLEAGHIDLLDDEPVDSAPVAPVQDAPVASEPDAAADDTADAPVFTMTHQGRGKYLIEGPGVEPGTIIQGKRDAETAIANFEAIAASKPGDLDAADDQDAPV